MDIHMQNMTQKSGDFGTKLQQIELYWDRIILGAYYSKVEVVMKEKDSIFI